MAATQIVNGAKVTLANTSDLELKFETLAGDPEDWRTATVTIVSCNAAGVQVGNRAITTAINWHAWAADSKVLISFKNGEHNIHLKGTSGDIIALTY